MSKCRRYSPEEIAELHGIETCFNCGNCLECKCMEDSREACDRWIPNIQIFEEQQLRDALDFAHKGNQSLHLFSNPGLYPGAPKCFKNEEQAGHLFDMDMKRLILSAKHFGVSRILVHKKGEPRQHIDLCRKPLTNAIEFIETIHTLTCSTTNL